MLKIKLLLLVALTLSCQKKTAKIEEDFLNLLTISSRFDEASSFLTVDISLDKSIHAYAEGEKVGIPVKLEVNEKNGWKKDGVVLLPQGTRKKLKSLGESMVIEGNFQVRQKLKKGQGQGEANLYLQVCSENLCDRPRVHNLKF